MTRRRLSYLLFFSILSYLGCSSTVSVSIKEYEPQTLKDYNPSEIFITTNDSIKYHFSNYLYYYTKNDTMYTKGKVLVYEFKEGKKVSKMKTTEFKIPLRELKSIEEVAPNEIKVITIANEEHQFENKGYYYIENDTLYGQGEIYSNEVSEYFKGNIAISDIIAVHTGLMFSGKSAEDEIDIVKQKEFESAEEISYDNYRDSDKGAEVTLSLKFGEIIQGELLSVRDSVLVMCKEYSAREEELAKGVYEIITIKSRDIQKITVKGESNFWEGVGYGALIGAALGIGIGLASGDDIPPDPNEPFNFFDVSYTAADKALMGLVSFTPIGAIIGGIVGAMTMDKVTINLLPGSNLSLLNIYHGTSLNTLLNQLSRYSEKEPEYLKAIK